MIGQCQALEAMLGDNIVDDDDKATVGPPI